MTKSAASIEIVINQSAIGGDVVAGDKIDVHLHPENLKSSDSVLEALSQQGLTATDSDNLIKQLLANPEFVARFDARRREHESSEVDIWLKDTLKEIDRIGVSSDMVSKLRDFVDRSRKNEDWITFSKAGTFLLQLYDADIEAASIGIPLADELVKLAQDNKNLTRNIPVARIYQARHLFFEYSDHVLKLQTALAARESLPVKFPLINFLAENKQILGYYSLADKYAREALDQIFSVGDAELAIHTLFGLAGLQEHAHFVYKYILKKDSTEIRERIFRIYELLQKITQTYGSQKDKISLDYNVAHFWHQIGDFEKAESLALSAAQAFAKIGAAQSAAKAIELSTAARKHESLVAPPPQVDIESLTTEQLISMTKEISSRLMKLQGFDYENDLRLKSLIDEAWKDQNPDRVLRYCEHISVACNTSPLGKSIMLPTLGPKKLLCRKFQRAVETQSLDRAFTFFKQQLGCESCKERLPRPADWNWSPKWAQDERKRNSA